MITAGYDASLSDFPRLAGENDDSGRFGRAVGACAGLVLFVPPGEYELATPLKIENLCSLLLHKSAVLRAVGEMEFLVEYDASFQHERGPEHEDFNLFIIGGEFDGNGLASCMMLCGFHHFTLRDTTFRNGRRYGLRVEDKKHFYELVATNVYCRCTKPGLAGNVGISTNGSDCHYTDCVVVDYTTGIDIECGGSNRLTRCHVWGGILPPLREGEDCEMLANSVCFRIGGGDTILRDCYADTAKIGFLILASTRLLGCSFFNNFRFKLDDTVVIDHRGGTLLVSDCSFTKTSPKATVYTGTGEVVWRDNIYNKFDPTDLPDSQRTGSAISKETVYEHLDGAQPDS
jgi:parallel beta helix pectate lyase-like protein